MAHNLETLTDGRASFAYVKRTEQDIPWHKLGQAVDPGCDSPEELAAAAGVDWMVALRPTYYVTQTAGTQLVPDSFVVVRENDEKVLGVVGNRYTPIQNMDAFTAVQEWLQDGRLRFETAGSLLGGRKVFGLARIGEDFYVGGKDQIIPYCLIVLGHDGITPITFKLCHTRVVCANTMGVAMHENTRRLTIRHTDSAVQRMKEASKALGLVSKMTLEMAERFDQLADIAATDDYVEDAFNIVVAMPAKGASEEERTKIMKQRLSLFNTYAHSSTVDRGTRWGIFNAVTEFIDHTQTRRGQNSDSKNPDWLERRALYTIDGAGEELRNKVFDHLTKDLVIA